MDHPLDAHIATFQRIAEIQRLHTRKFRLFGPRCACGVPAQPRHPSLQPCRTRPSPAPRPQGDSVTAYAWEREEARDARRYATAACYQHHYHPNGRGGGVCDCGDTISKDEL